MSKQQQPVIYRKIASLEKKISRQIDKIKSIAYEEFELLVPEADKIISEANTDFDFISYIFSALMNVVVIVEKDEKVVDKAYELLKYAISMDMKESIVLVLQYNFIMDDIIDQITIGDFVDDDFLSFFS